MDKQRFLPSLVRNERGATSIEYGLIASLVVVATIAAVANLASTTTGMWNEVADNVSAH